MEGPTLKELAVQALSSVERGYDLLAPKFDATPFRTPDWMLAATTTALREHGPFGRGLDVCTGTGAGLELLAELTAEPPTGVDFSVGMLERARDAHPGVDLVRADARALPFDAAYDLVVSFGALGHFLPEERPALFDGIRRALRPGGVFALPVGRAPGPTQPAYWLLTGFDLVMRVRNAVWRPKFVMYSHPSAAGALRRPQGRRVRGHHDADARCRRADPRSLTPGGRLTARPQPRRGFRTASRAAMAGMITAAATRWETTSMMLVA